MLSPELIAFPDEPARVRRFTSSLTEAWSALTIVTRSRSGRRTISPISTLAVRSPSRPAVAPSPSTSPSPHVDFDDDSVRLTSRFATSRSHRRVIVEGWTPSASASSPGRCGPRLASTTSARYCGNVTSSSTAASERTATDTNTREARRTASTTSRPESCIVQVLHTAPLPGLRLTARCCGGAGQLRRMSSSRASTSSSSGVASGP